MGKDDLQKLLNRFKEKMAAEKNTSADIQGIIQDIQKFLGSHVNCYVEDFLQFITCDAERLKAWKNYAKSPENECFWNSMLAWFFSGDIHLRLLDLSAELIQALKDTNLFKNNRTHLNYQKCMCNGMMGNLGQLAVNIAASKYPTDKIQLWELLILSGVPDAMRYAFEILNITPDTKNAYGETPMDIAIKSGFYMQVDEALRHGCHLPKNELTPHQPLTPTQAYVSPTHTKVPVYIDFLIHPNSSTTYSEGLLLSHEEILQDEINFQLIAERLTHHFKTHVEQVGETPNQLNQIITQFSCYNYNYDAAHYRIKVLVDKQQLGKLSTSDKRCKDDPVATNDTVGYDTEPYRILSTGTTFLAEDILSIELCVHNFHDTLNLPHYVENKPHDANAPVLSKIRNYLKFVLEADRVNNYIVFREPRMPELVELCANNGTMVLNAFKSLINEKKPHKYSPSTIYQTILDANCWEDVWDNCLQSIAEMAEKTEEPFSWCVVS